MTITTLEDLSVELFYEIFMYFQYHEVFNIFSNLNRRFSTIINKMPLMPVYLGYNGTSMDLAEFYHRHLSQTNLCNRLLSLCVSDKITIDNGLWLASHLSTFINLRYLSLIDIKRFSFELILDTCSPVRSLVMFRVNYSLSSFGCAIYTFRGVPEGAYYEQIFRLFPYLHICDLGFCRSTDNVASSEIVLPLNKTFVPIQTRLLNLQKLVLRKCSIPFLLHLLEHHPQLHELSFELSTPWLPDSHPLFINHDKKIYVINKSLTPNLRRLKITSDDDINEARLLNELFDRDVLFSLTNFTLLGLVTGVDVVHNILSMLNHQCSYTLMIRWYMKTEIPVLDTNIILLNTFRQLKGRIPIELNLSLYTNRYSIDAFTIPRIDRSLSDHSYLDKDIIHGYGETSNFFLEQTANFAQFRQSYWSSKMSTLNQRWKRLNHIDIKGTHCQIDNEFFFYLTTIASWHQITSLIIHDPLNLEELYFIFCKMITLRKLCLHYHFDYNSDENSNEQKLIDFFNDTSLCNILISIGLQKLVLYTDWIYSDLTKILSLVVKNLSCLQIIEIFMYYPQILDILLILINGLPKLNFIIYHANCECKEQIDSIMYGLQKYSKRPYRIEFCNFSDNFPLVFVWL